MAQQYPAPPPDDEPGHPAYTKPADGGPAADNPYAAPQTPPAYGYPAAGPPQPASLAMPGPLTVPGAVPAGTVLTLGDIAVADDTIVTPAGPMPLKGAVWTCTDMSRTQEKIQTAGIVLAVVFVSFCAIGLLFLLMKERITTGYVQVTVDGGGRHHATLIPVQSPEQVMYVFQQVAYARSLSV
ncbi:membrane protein [Streptomyces natalensis]|uniref:Membrane protein n=1 Tax=Streptomyces natalensis ATCC 27448 TaxID=1240678 RepID=A0A0D7CUH2_9ACTN|nr:membrane protein [Streptomyces natalensis]KIZ19686.1 membrane protein [Streptomyces natalensis ATCC 27448]